MATITDLRNAAFPSSWELVVDETGESIDLGDKASLGELDEACANLLMREGYPGTLYLSCQEDANGNRVSYEFASPFTKRFKVEWTEPGEGRITDTKGEVPTLRFALDDCAQDMARRQKKAVLRAVAALNKGT